MKKVFIVIVNWNNFKDTIACVRSLRVITYSKYEVVIVDNGSSNNSDDILRKTFPNIAILQAGKNLGFAGGNNIGIKYALEHGTDYIMLLNSDTTVNKNFLKPLVNFLQSHPSAGAIQSKLLRMNNPKIIDSSGQEIGPFVVRDRDFGLKDSDHQASTEEIFGPCAAAALYRKEIFEKVGFFNEQFFMVFEDVDLSWRMRENGWDSWLSPQSLVYHRRGVSGGTLEGFIGFHAFKNKIYMKLKYYPFDTVDYIKIPIKVLKLSVKSIRYKLLFTFWSFFFNAVKHRFRYRGKNREIYVKWVYSQN